MAIDRDDRGGRKGRVDVFAGIAEPKIYRSLSAAVAAVAVPFTAESRG